MYIKKLRIAVLLGMLLVASLAGEAGARDRVAVSAWKYVTVPAGHFHPYRDGIDWTNYGRYISLNSGNGAFNAPVVFPGSGPVVVKKIALYATDYNSTHDLQAALFKTNPATGGETEMARVVSSGSAPGPRDFSDTTITYAKIQRTHGTYLLLQFEVSSNLQVHGVKIAYTD